MPPREKKLDFNPLVVGGVLLAAAVIVLLVEFDADFSKESVWSRNAN